MYKRIISITISLMSLFLAQSSYGGDASIGYGLGIANSAKRSPVETKMFTAAVRPEIYKGIYWQVKGGYWGDGSADPARSSSFFASTGPGMLIDLRPIEIRSGWGIAVISSPDAYLGGRFPQFNGNAYIGLRDKNGSGIGAEYNHVSSAGLVRPNEGRDFIVLELSKKW